MGTQSLGVKQKAGICGLPQRHVNHPTLFCRNICTAAEARDRAQGNQSSEDQTRFRCGHGSLVCQVRRPFDNKFIRRALTRKGRDGLKPALRSTHLGNARRPVHSVRRLGAHRALHRFRTAHLLPLASTATRRQLRGLGSEMPRELSDSETRPYGLRLNDSCITRSTHLAPRLHY